MEGPEKVFQETGSCYPCRKRLEGDVEIKGICEDCLRLESIQVQRAFGKLKEANTIAKASSEPLRYAFRLSPDTHRGPGNVKTRVLFPVNG